MKKDMQTIKSFYWGENLDDYFSFNEPDYNEIIEIKRLNFFIGKNNAGKSRFLRSLYLSEKIMNIFNYYNYPKSFFESSLTDEFLKKFEEEDFLSYAKDLDSSAVMNQFKEIRDNSRKYIDCDEDFVKFSSNGASIFSYYKHENGNYIFPKEVELYDCISKKENQPFLEKYYIPVLRGLRGVNNPQDTCQDYAPYKERSLKDYFLSSANSENLTDSEGIFVLTGAKEVNLLKTIVTGEDFYQTLLHYSNGDEHQWSIIEEYENALSKYFFDNNRIKLIAKNNQEVSHHHKTVDIKIGSEPQLPIYHLGDGLQQVIILTYQAFIAKNETHAFFIEEPELHMHAGMLRQLMNFYLNETKHYYFFTTHSNHLLDMSDESDQVIIQKFVKKPKADESGKFNFEIYRCDRDRDLLASLGVRPSSVYLANCTIWVEGITDRLYITKYMEKYLGDLKNSSTQDKQKLYVTYRRFMPNYHYTFVEYSGSNLAHWAFDNKHSEFLEDRGLSAKVVTSDMLLIADGDIRSRKKRLHTLDSELKKDNLLILDCKESENTLPKDSIIRVAKKRFLNMKEKTKNGFDIEKLCNDVDEAYFHHKKYGIGKLLDDCIRIDEIDQKKAAFADGTSVGTIKFKLEFCRDILRDFDKNPEWTLTDEAKKICEKIFEHIERCNS